MEIQTENNLRNKISELSWKCRSCKILQKILKKKIEEISALREFSRGGKYEAKSIKIRKLKDKKKTVKKIFVQTSMLLSQTEMELVMKRIELIIPKDVVYHILSYLPNKIICSLVVTGSPIMSKYVSEWCVCCPGSRHLLLIHNLENSLKHWP